MLLLMFLLASFLISWAGTTWLSKHAHTFSMLEEPNHRSSHSLPTPTSGGTVFVGLWILGTLVCWVAGYTPLMQSISLAASGLLIAIVGWIDDRYSLKRTTRLLTQLIASAFTALLLLAGTPILDSYTTILIGLVIVAMVWMINAFNFVDGIDGYAGSITLLLLSSIGMLCFLKQQYSYGFLSVCGLPALLGFILVNWPPAKIFMGDVGSTFLGFLTAALAIITVTEGVISPISWLVLLAPVLSDTTFTLAVRLITGQDWHTAHRSHCYQILARRWRSHKKVTLLVCAYYLCWLIPIATLVEFNQQTNIFLLLTAWLPWQSLVCFTRAGFTTRLDNIPNTNQ